MSSLVIARRFNGPSGSGNGGYTAGALAEASGLPQPVTVQLRRPPPLERPLALVETDGAVELRDRDTLIATARHEGPAAWSTFEPVSLERARQLESGYAGHSHHPFPRCFSCGTDREDGLRIFPGRIDDTTVAASWTPDDSLLENGALPQGVVWAGLDCVGGWSSDLENRPLVLGEMVARVQSPPQAGTPYVMVGRLVKTEGRKTWTATAMLDADGRLFAQSEQLWIEVSPEVVAQLQAG